MALYDLGHKEYKYTAFVPDFQSYFLGNLLVFRIQLRSTGTLAISDLQLAV